MTCSMVGVFITVTPDDIQATLQSHQGSRRDFLMAQKYALMLGHTRLLGNDSRSSSFVIKTVRSESSER